MFKNRNNVFILGLLENRCQRFTAFNMGARVLVKNMILIPDKLKKPHLASYYDSTKYGFLRHEAELDSQEFNLIVGTLLGKGELRSTPLGDRWSAHFNHKAINEPYIWHKYQRLKPFFITKPRYLRYVDPETGEKSFRFQINTMPFDGLQVAARIFYYSDEGVRLTKKRVPQYIKMYLTQEALAYWYMDSGAWDGYSNSVNFITNTPDVVEAELLKTAMEENFELKCSMEMSKGRFVISTAEESYERLRYHMFFYLFPCMYYKFPDGAGKAIGDGDIFCDVQYKSSKNI